MSRQANAMPPLDPHQLKEATMKEKLITAVFNVGHEMAVAANESYDQGQTFDELRSTTLKHGARIAIESAGVLAGEQYKDYVQKAGEHFSKAEDLGLPKRREELPENWFKRKKADPEADQPATDSTSTLAERMNTQEFAEWLENTQQSMTDYVNETFGGILLKEKKVFNVPVDGKMTKEERDVDKLVLARPEDFGLVTYREEVGKDSEGLPVYEDKCAVILITDHGIDLTRQGYGVDIKQNVGASQNSAKPKSKFAEKLSKIMPDKPAPEYNPTLLDLKDPVQEQIDFRKANVNRKPWESPVDPNEFHKKAVKKSEKRPKQSWDDLMEMKKDPRFMMEVEDRSGRSTKIDVRAGLAGSLVEQLAKVNPKIKEDIWVTGDAPTETRATLSKMNKGKALMFKNHANYDQVGGNFRFRPVVVWDDPEKPVPGADEPTIETERIYAKDLTHLVDGVPVELRKSTWEEPPKGEEDTDESS